jgi:predicted outer membrane repeat protein
MFNYAENFGGAIYLTQSSTYYNSLYLRFENNKANISGGAISVLKFLNITIEL